MFPTFGWIMPLLIFSVWFLCMFAAVFEKRADEVRRAVPVERRGGVSILPIIPLFPLSFWGVAWLLDHYLPPWGTLIVGGLHIVLTLLMLITLFRDLPAARHGNQRI